MLSVGVCVCLCVYYYILGHVWRDAGSSRHQRDGQDEAQGEVDESRAAKQHGQVEQTSQFQHPPTLLRALARDQPETHV